MSEINGPSYEHMARKVYSKPCQTWDEVFFENTKIVSRWPFCKTFHLRCLTVLWIRNLGWKSGITDESKIPNS